MNYEDDNIIQCAKDSNGGVYNRIKMLREQVNKLQMENLLLKNKLDGAEITLTESKIREAFEVGIQKMFGR